MFTETRSTNDIYLLFYKFKDFLKKNRMKGIIKE